jgi:hypothetical protein
LTTCRDVIPATLILVPFAALSLTSVSLISHPCLADVLRLMRERFAPVSARTLILKIGFLTVLRCKYSGNVGLHALTLLHSPISVIALMDGLFIFHPANSAVIFAHSSPCSCCCCWCLCCCCCQARLNYWNSSNAARSSSGAVAEATCLVAFRLFPL